MSRRPSSRPAGARPAVRAVAGATSAPDLTVGRGRTRSQTRSPLPAAPRGTAGGRRLTARGRVVLVVVSVLALVAALVVATGGVSSAGQSGRSVVQPVVVVQPGQTLWELARTVAPGVDPRVTVAQIRELNSLSSSTVLPGQQLSVPVG